MVLLWESVSPPPFLRPPNPKLDNFSCFQPDSVYLATILHINMLFPQSLTSGNVIHRWKVNDRRITSSESHEDCHH
jgi:hypothetical protein